MSNNTKIQETAETDVAPQRVEPAGPTYTPAVDIYEDEKSIVLMADMPGVDKTSVEATLEGGILTLDGKANAPVPAEGEWARREYEPGRYRRVFEVSDRIDADGVKASMKWGVLRVVLPKKEEAKPRRISVAVA